MWEQRGGADEADLRSGWGHRRRRRQRLVVSLFWRPRAAVGVDAHPHPRAGGRSQCQCRRRRHLFRRPVGRRRRLRVWHVSGQLSHGLPPVARSPWVPFRRWYGGCRRCPAPLAVPGRGRRSVHATAVSASGVADDMELVVAMCGLERRGWVAGSADPLSSCQDFRRGGWWQPPVDAVLYTRSSPWAADSLHGPF